ncbi:DNA-directed RNA polymerase subunit alpha [Candidatus Azambacteria bacterium]|nr:DNA-directed RNA polymerase subunit alpha [Candidatus Azambacteria bacterium]
MYMEITLPKQPKVTKKDGSKAIIEIDELYPGYGMTLGNALRRVLLSSLPGAAVTFVKIKGVSHEFSTVPHVMENVVDILLNVKQLRFKLHSDEPQIISIKASGDRAVTGHDIKAPSQVEVVNKDLVIATLTDKKADFEMELTVEKGRGYVPVEDRKKHKLEVGVIAVDSIFTPIRKIDYDVEDMRVGDRTDFNKLKLSMDTDCSIDPEEAFYDAIDILVNQFSRLKRSDLEVKKADDEILAEESEKESKDDVSKMKISELDLSARTVSALEDASIKTVAGLIKKTESAILDLDGMGEKGLSEIKKALKGFGLELKK